MHVDLAARDTELVGEKRLGVEAATLAVGGFEGQERHVELGWVPTAGGERVVLHDAGQLRARSGARP